MAQANAGSGEDGVGGDDGAVNMEIDDDGRITLPIFVLCKRDGSRQNGLSLAAFAALVQEKIAIRDGTL